MTEQDEWAFWREARAGGKPLTTPGTPHSGFFRSYFWTADGAAEGKRVKASRGVSIWRDGDDRHGDDWQCLVTSGYCPNNRIDIDELFASCCNHSISREEVMRVLNGGRFDDDVPIIDIGTGHNNPPDDLTPDQALAAEISAMEAQCRAWLKGLPNGTPQTKAEANLCANYAIKFGEFEKRASDAHKIEKAPFLESGRLVDAKWFAPVRDIAAGLKAKIKAIGDGWLTRENARLAEEARKVNEAARAAAAEADRKAREEADKAGAAPPPKTVVQEVVAERTKIGTAGRSISQRSKKEWVIEDMPAVSAYFAGLETPPAELIEVLTKLANKVCAAGVSVPGTKAVTTTSSV